MIKLKDLKNTSGSFLPEKQKHTCFSFGPCDCGASGYNEAINELAEKDITQWLSVKLCENQGCKRGSMFNYDTREWYDCPVCHGNGAIIEVKKCNKANPPWDFKPNGKGKIDGK